MNSLFDQRLRNFPPAVKALAFGYIMALGLSYLYAIVNIALVVGLTPKDIAIHYYGSETRIEVPKAEGEQALDLDALDGAGGEAAPVQHPQPSLKNLVAEGHFHLFGMSSFFFGLTLLGVFTAIPNRWKPWAVGIPYPVIIIDNVSFLITRFGGPEFAYLTAVAGGLMAVCFTILWVSVLYEVLPGRSRA